jgi:cell division protease FtsH
MKYFIILLFFHLSNSFVINNYVNKIVSLYDINSNNHNNENNPFYRKYPLSRNMYEMQLKRLNSKNITTQLNEINKEAFINDEDDNSKNKFKNKNKLLKKQKKQQQPEITIFLNKQTFDFDYDEEDDDIFPRKGYKGSSEKLQNGKKGKKSENFEVIQDFPITFKDVGGYEHIKEELLQCVDSLKNYNLYEKFNVRIPKGVILEGPPGNGKTLLAKGLAGETKINYISVSGSQFQEKYVGVGSSRIRELFQLALKNIPCIIFIDEIDAVGRKRSDDGEGSTSERDNTLNELLVGLDGFKNTNGIFIIGATNRLDLLDKALIRPGRIDKSIYIGLPNSKTREFVIKMHIQGKPYDENTIKIDDLVDLTKGLSCAQIENLLNEAMLLSLRNKKNIMTYDDIDTIMNRILAGWQSSDHEFTEEMIHHICVHEMGHVITGLLCKYHSKIKKVTVNLSSPKSPAYTVFEGEDSTIYTRQSLFEHIIILLAGRIAENEIFGSSFISTGASNDFEESIKLAENMVKYYGMGKSTIYPNNSEMYKQMIDKDVFDIINDAYHQAEYIIRNSKDFILRGSLALKEKKVLTLDEIQHLYLS